MKTLKSILALIAVFVFNTFAFANLPSNITHTTEVASTNTLTMTIERLIAKSKDSCNEKMDFYTIAKMNRRNLGKKGIKEGNNIRPNWSYKTKVVPNATVAVELEVWDEDDTWCGGGDDRVDVTNYLSETLKLRVNTRTKLIYDEKNKYVGKIGQSLTFRGSSYRNSPASGDNIETGTVTVKFHLRESIQTKRLGAVVKRLIARSQDACNKKMDFYSKIKIAGKRMKTSSVKEGNHIRPNWADYHNVRLNSSLQQVAIEIWDEDDALCGGKDDRVDIVSTNSQLLIVYVDVKAGIVYADGRKRKRLGRVNQTLRTEGNAHRTYSALNLSKKNIEAGWMEYMIYLR